MKILLLLLLTIAHISPSLAHNHGKNTVFSQQKLSDSLYMLSGKGGNLALSVGEDGLLLVDSDYADISDQTLDAIARIDKSPIQFVINTHWHFDHTGANKDLGQSGSIIIAHDNVRQRLQTGGLIKAFAADIAPAAQSALPVITFEEKLKLHWNDESIDVVHHMASAHTDGDAVVYFHKSNVIHMGDLYFNGLYPFIDASSGGSIHGVIKAVDIIINKIDDNTQVIPGHGKLSNRANLIEYRNMLQNMQQVIGDLKAKGHNKQQVIDSKPSAQYDSIWGQGFLKPDVWVGVVYDAL